MKIPLTKSVIRHFESVVDGTVEEFSIPGAFRVYYDEKLSVCILELLEAGDSNAQANFEEPSQAVLSGGTQLVRFEF